jgi:predicted SnoaL-like aldol condensation-catalyzing enzyme
MRKLLSLAAIGACSLLIACSSNSGGMSATAKKNLETNQAITKAYEAGEFDKMKDLIAPDAIDHAGENGDVKGLDSIVASMKRYKAMAPDMKGTTIREMADDEYVFSWGTSEGTMNGQKMSMTAVDIAKFKDGKAIEHWMFMTPADIMKMMPPMPADQGGPAKPDSAGN